MSALTALIAKPPLLYAGLSLAVLAAIWINGAIGHRNGRAACEAAHRTAAAAEIVRQRMVSLAATRRAEDAAVAAAAKDNDNLEIVRHVEKTMAARPDAHDVCVPGAVADGLRGLD